VPGAEAIENGLSSHGARRPKASQANCPAAKPSGARRAIEHHLPAVRAERCHRRDAPAGPAVARTLTLPQIRREVAIDNAAGTGTVAVPTGAALTVYTDGTANGIRPIGGVGGVGGGGDPGGVFGRVMLPFHGALAVKTATQAIAASVTTPISYDAVGYDTRGFWSAGAPTRLTVPAGVTRVIVSASTRFTGGTGSYQTVIRRNGVEVNGIASQSMASGFTAGHINMSTAVLSVTAGDWFEVLAFTSAARTIDSGARTWMAIAVVETADAAEPPADWPFRREGTPGASEVLLRAVLARRTRLAVDFALSRGHAGIAATAQTDFDVQRNGTSIGTVRFPAGSATATFIAGSAVTCEPGDRLTVVAPATPDATLAYITVTLAGALVV
jgi:hypothetical protein